MTVEELKEHGEHIMELEDCHIYSYGDKFFKATCADDDDAQEVVAVRIDHIVFKYADLVTCDDLNNKVSVADIGKYELHYKVLN